MHHVSAVYMLRNTAAHCRLATAALPGHEAAVSPLAVLHSAAAGLDCSARLRSSVSVLHKNCMTFTHLQNQDLARTLVLKHLPSRRYNKMFIILHKLSLSDTLYNVASSCILQKVKLAIIMLCNYSRSSIGHQSSLSLIAHT